MVLKKGTQLWLERAQYDWETAAVMLSSGRHLYVVFMCQQAIEKLLKGCVHHKTGKLPPYTHNLVKLAECLDVTFSEEQLDFLTLLTGYYLNTRYPDYKQRLAAELNQGKAQEIFQRTKEIFTWLQKQIGT